MAAVNRVFTPEGFPELFSTWDRFPDSVLYAGGTELIRRQGSIVPVLPSNIISLHKMEELRKISRTERYLEIGAMVSLGQIIRLGKIVPEVLISCLESIAGPQLRNSASIGGNICNPGRRLDASAPMIALDAQFELRTAQSSRWVAAARFSSLPGPPVMAPYEILTRIRIPLEPWNFTRYFKFSTPGLSEPGGCILFILRNQKNLLTSIRIIYSGQTILREKNAETQLAGKHLPLEKKDAAALVESWKTYLSTFKSNEKFVFGRNDRNSNPELVKAQILNFIENTIMQISD
ncbi:MAG: FAD binding domain-containing protein [Treponema sp.]|nr:FAD binding domain-containing protein [Treponema sp.]